MDKRMKAQLEEAEAAQAQKRAEWKIAGNGPETITSELAKLPKCGPNSPAASPPVNPDWPPESLRPVRFESDLTRWAAFDWGRHPALARAKPVIVDWYNGLPESGALLLAGNYGCGKTHIADAIADLVGRWRVSMIEETALVKKIHATYGGNGNEEHIWSSIFRSDLLILDDLGTYETTNDSWLSNFYTRVFNDYMTVRHKPVLITTNLEMAFSAGQPVGIEARIGGRLNSRLCEAMGDMKNYVDLFDVPDMRIEGFLR